MKKMLMVLGLMLFAGGFARAEELHPQMRIWKSSALQGGNYSNVLMSTSPIIFHMVVGSAAYNQGDNNYFVLLRSTRNPLTTNASTKAFVLTNSAFGSPSMIGFPVDVFSDSNTFFSKQGGAVVNYLWDYYKSPPFDPFPKD